MPNKKCVQINVKSKECMRRSKKVELEQNIKQTSDSWGERRTNDRVRWKKARKDLEMWGPTTEIYFCTYVLDFVFCQLSCSSIIV